MSTMLKAITTAASILVCFAAISATYYYAKYLPRVHDAELAEQRRKTDLGNTQRCNKDALNFYSDYRADFRKEYMSAGLDWSDPEMHFNKKLNTCLVEITARSDVTSGGSLYEQSVTDIYSNREIIRTAYTYEGFQEKAFGQMDHKGYSAEKAKLFGE